MIRSGGFPRIAPWIVACVATAVLVASCGSDNGSSSTPTTATATTAGAAATTTEGSTTAGTSAAPSGDVCADREALRTSVAALKAVDVKAKGTNGAKAAVGAVKQDLVALGSSAGAELQPQVKAVQSAADQAETAVGNIDSGGAAPAVTAVASVVTSATTLLTSLQARPCATSATT